MRVSETSFDLVCTCTRHFSTGEPPYCLSPQIEHTSEAASVLCTSLILVAPRRAARAATSGTVHPSPVRDGLRIAVYLGKGGNATMGQWNNWANERLNVLCLFNPRLMRVTALWMTFGFFRWSEYLTMTLALGQCCRLVWWSKFARF